MNPFHFLKGWGKGPGPETILTLIVPASYTAYSWDEEVVRLYGRHTRIHRLNPADCRHFQRLRYDGDLLFVGTGHHLPGLFDTDEKISFWRSQPGRKYLYQFERTIDDLWGTGIELERRAILIDPTCCAVQDEQDALAYEKTFGLPAIWLPDMISRRRVALGRQNPPLRKRPVDVLFVGKTAGEWYAPRRAALEEVRRICAAQGLRMKIIDTSERRVKDSEILALFREARIVLNPIGAGAFFNIRFFEALAAGCVCLQQTTREGAILERFADRYRNYAACHFRTVTEIGPAIEDVISRLPEWEKIARDTFDLLERNDTAEARFATLGIPFPAPL